MGGEQLHREIRLHTSKRMHFIEDRDARGTACSRITCIRQNVCTSLRSGYDLRITPRVKLAYVKTYALH